MDDEFFSGVIVMIVVFCLFVFGYGCKKQDMENDMIKQKAIYIKDDEYRCSKVSK